MKKEYKYKITVPILTQPRKGESVETFINRCKVDMRHAIKDNIMLLGRIGEPEIKIEIEISEDAF